MTCAIIVSIKDENKYLDEWITYHQKLGVNHIFIIDNNDIDGEDPYNIINKYNDYITYMNSVVNNRMSMSKNIMVNNYYKKVLGD